MESAYFNERNLYICIREMKYRFLIALHLYLLSVDTWGFMPLYQELIFRYAQTANLLGVVRDLRQEFFDMLPACGCASHIYGCCYPYGLIPEHFSADLRFISIGIDIFAILLLGFFPSGMSPVVALYPVFFAMPFQWCTFKAPGGYNSSTIFSTNNLRQFTTAVTQFLGEKDSTVR